MSFPTSSSTTASEIMTTSAFAPSPSRMPLFPTTTAPAAPAATAATAQHLHAPSYFSTPRSSAPTDSTRIWAAMPPFQNTSHDQSQAQRKSNPPPVNVAQENNEGGLLFITGNKPDDFKSKKNMTKVRKKAMGSYLEHTKDKKPRDSLERSRLKSDGSTASSRASNGSQDGDSELLTREDALRIWKGEKGNRRQSSRKQSSPVKSPGSCDHDQGTSPDMQIANLGQSVNFVLPTAPIVLPMRSGIELPYDVTHPRPFVSIGKSLDPFRTMFQANHPRVSVEELKFHCSRVFGTRAMGQHWIPAIVKSPHAFLSTLCIASAHHDAIQEQPTESLRTVALRQEVIHLISQNLLHPTARVDDDNVIALTQLIASEIISREDMSLNYHETGVEAMITQRGGVNQLGVKGRLASTISWVSLESAILREAAPRSVYSDFCASACTRSYPSTATVPESPVYCPRGEFETIKRSKIRDPRTLDLLKEIRMMTELFLHETRQSRQNFQSLKNLHKKITTQYPSIADLQKTNVITQDDWRYEAIRIAAVIQATAIIKRTPLSEALTHASESRKPLSLYTSAASKSSISHEPQISPLTLRQDSPVTNVSTSPSYTTSPVFPQSNTNPYFMARSSVSSGGSPHNLSMNLSYFSPPATAPPTESAALLLNLKTAIQNSNLSDCWADMAGVLLWIGLIVGAASRKSENTIRKWFSALAVRVSIVLCFEHPEAVHSTLLKVGEIVEALGTGSASTSATVETPRRESETLGKRRKVS